MLEDLHDFVHDSNGVIREFLDLPFLFTGPGFRESSGNVYRIIYLSLCLCMRTQNIFENGPKWFMHKAKV